MRLARPTRLIDINRIAALSYIRANGETIAIGATTRQCVAERDTLVAGKVPLLSLAIPFIGHAATRARGPVGGSLAHADPAAELSLIAVTLGATMTYRVGGKDGAMTARDFFCRSDGHQPPGGRLPDRRRCSRNSHTMTKGR
jgi:CO/xanthine dehydrogenase FAD-binding subunit